MKFFLLLITIAPFLSYGQFNGGEKFIGGNIAIKAVTSPNANSSTSPHIDTRFSIIPRLGFMVSSKTAIGLLLGYTNEYQEYKNTAPAVTSVKFETLTAGAFVRRYIMISEKFYFVPDATIEFARQYYSVKQPVATTTLTTTSDYYTFTTTIRPLLAFFPSRRWGFEGGVGSISFSHAQLLPSKASMNTFNFDVGTVTLGIAYYFSRKSSS